MSQEALSLQEEGERLFKEHKLDEASAFYKEAALLFKQARLHTEAARCFSQSSLCQKMHTGLVPLLEAGNLSEMGAREALAAGDFATARWLYRDAGFLYEREGDFERYSRCFVESQHAYVRYLWYVFSRGTVLDHGKPPRPASPGDRLNSLVKAFFGFISRWVWGYGESPFRILMTGVAVIFVCALVYHTSGLLNSGTGKALTGFSNALYLSGVTFTTLGYGDVVPTGWVRFVAAIEGASGFLLVPMLVIALTRRYLRVYR